VSEASEEGGKVTAIPVKFKDPPSGEGPTLKLVKYGDGCNHMWAFRGSQKLGASYIIREGETEVECGLCGTRLNPMFVLSRLAGEETRWHQARANYQNEMKRLKDRSRTKCEHCDRMTRISRK
jgi:hypothetical protein